MRNLAELNVIGTEKVNKDGTEHFRVHYQVEEEKEVAGKKIKTLEVKSSKSNVEVPEGKQLVEVKPMAIQSKLYFRILSVVKTGK